jgi:hypothetical protein
VSAPSPVQALAEDARLLSALRLLSSPPARARWRDNLMVATIEARRSAVLSIIRLEELGMIDRDARVTVDGDAVLVIVERRLARREEED